MADEIRQTKIGEGIWQFSEGEADSHSVEAYLIAGTQRALVVDTLQSLPGLYEKVRELTRLPVDVVITHGHIDHGGVSTREFAEAGCKVYMDMRDFDLLRGMVDYGPEKEWFTDVKDGQVFSLGGFDLELISVPGHSPGSLVLLEREKGLLFTGDSIGAGVFWMQLDACLPLEEFLPSIQRLRDETKDIENLLVYPGHRSQSPVQLTGEFIDDVLAITRGIIDGTMVGEAQEIDFGEMKMKFSSVAHGLMKSYCYNPERILKDS